MGILNAIWCALIKFWNAIQEHIIDSVIELIAWLIDLLPSLPIENEPLPWGEFGKSVGYFLPLGTMAQHFSIMLGLMLIWYSYEYAMRWLKMIR